MFLQRITAAAFVLLGALTVAGCSSESSSSGCQPLPEAAASYLSQALESGRLNNPVYVRSNDFEHVYMVAASVNGQPAVWAMNELNGTGLIYSLNEQAYQVSGMGRGQDLTDPITNADDGVEEALACV